MSLKQIGIIDDVRIVGQHSHKSHTGPLAGNFFASAKAASLMKMRLGLALTHLWHKSSSLGDGYLVSHLLLRASSLARPKASCQYVEDA